MEEKKSKKVIKKVLIFFIIIMLLYSSSILIRRYVLAETIASIKYGTEICSGHIQHVEIRCGNEKQEINLKLCEICGKLLVNSEICDRCLKDTNICPNCGKIKSEDWQIKRIGLTEEWIYDKVSVYQGIRTGEQIKSLVDVVNTSNKNDEGILVTMNNDKSYQYEFVGKKAQKYKVVLDDIVLNFNIYDIDTNNISDCVVGVKNAM